MGRRIGMLKWIWTKSYKRE